MKSVLRIANTAVIHTLHVPAKCHSRNYSTLLWGDWHGTATAIPVPYALCTPAGLRNPQLASCFHSRGPAANDDDV